MRDEQRTWASTRSRVESTCTRRVSSAASTSTVRDWKAPTEVAVRVQGGAMAWHATVVDPFPRRTEDLYSVGPGAGGHKSLRLLDAHELQGDEWPEDEAAHAHDE